MDHNIVHLYEGLLKWNSPITSVERRDNFILIRLVEHSYCGSSFSIILAPVNMSRSHPKYQKFLEWVGQEFISINCSYDCWDKDYWDDDIYEQPEYDGLQEEIEMQAAKREQRKKKNIWYEKIYG